ncbi:hypothetical protein NUW54_g3946 [Trametes sanguinea]|uniref:Uncharacterized protein n=1 Tax=Trametes sanguinea TaxID=158606 RepID=A0ACC1Q1G5_9APHY|nr:hypothetical protein NUW54_g3946 [Trametes sanguinea]
MNNFEWALLGTDFHPLSLLQPISWYPTEWSGILENLLVTGSPLLWYYARIFSGGNNEPGDCGCDPRFKSAEGTPHASSAAYHHSFKQGKTKAKKRYLKAKKERRKKRKTLTKSGAATGTQATSGKDQQVSDESDSSESESESDDASEAEVEAPKSSPAQRTQTEEPRPKKRRKLDTPERDTLRPQSPVRAPPEPTVTTRPRSPTPPVALPAFPQPRRPDAPSKTVLALQGLDKALIEAEIIDPATTLPLQALQDTQDERTGLSGRMCKRLSDLGIAELFAVQTAVVPLLLSASRARSLYRPFDPPEDLCVSAPTGSGKTLAYVLPIVEILSSRVVTRLRALVVLPTRDLVVQVRETFEAVAKGRGLKIGTATGQHSFAHEQAQLVAERHADLSGGSSKVDILICTPGRLIDHLNGTPNFSLQHLRFLVIDEADRLLAQSFQDWLAQVLAATRPPRPSDGHRASDFTSEASAPLETRRSLSDC